MPLDVLPDDAVIKASGFTYFPKSKQRPESVFHKQHDAYCRDDENDEQGSFLDVKEEEVEKKEEKGEEKEEKGEDKVEKGENKVEKGEDKGEKVEIKEEKDTERSKEDKQIKSEEIEINPIKTGENESSNQELLEKEKSKSKQELDVDPKRILVDSVMLESADLDKSKLTAAKPKVTKQYNQHKEKKPNPDKVANISIASNKTASKMKKPKQNPENSTRVPTRTGPSSLKTETTKEKSKNQIRSSHLSQFPK